MFEYHCSKCEKRQLIFWSQIEGIVNDEAGIHVVVTCWCGESGRIDTGRTLAAA